MKSSRGGRFWGSRFREGRAATFSAVGGPKAHPPLGSASSEE